MLARKRHPRHKDTGKPVGFLCFFVAKYIKAFPRMKASQRRVPMKKSSLATVTIGAVLALHVSLVFAAAKADFTGTWVMDKSRSEGVPPDVEQTMILKQSEDKLTVENRITGGDNDLTVSDTYVINGKEVEFTQKVNDQESKGKRTSKWLADGSGFESSEELTRQAADGTQITQQVTRKWVMAPDGKMFTVEMSVKGPNGVRQTKRVFVKK
jgi:hypothetical protein